MFIFNLYGPIILIAVGTIVFFSYRRIIDILSVDDRQELMYCITFIFFGGLIGARIYHLLHLWQYYSLHPIEALFIWQGGLALYGAVFGGLLGLYIFCRFRQLNFLQITDSIFLYFPLAQAIGRLGNYFNQELYGLPTDLPWGIFINPENRLPGFQQYTRFHPLFTYDAIASLIVFIILKRFEKNLTLHFGQGSILAAWMLFYGSVRFFLEPFRLDPWAIGRINTAQAISLMLTTTSLGFFIKRRLEYNHKKLK